MPEIPRVPWTELKEDFLYNWGWPNGKWEPEHVSVLGPTGSGKTAWMTSVLEERTRRSGASAVILATKPADGTMMKLTRKGWKLRRTWPPDYGEDRVIYWPPSGKPEDGVSKQKMHIRNFLNDIWRPDANVIVCFDEIAFCEQELRLQPIINRMWREARSTGITLMASTQRPRGVSRYMHSEPTYSVAFRPSDQDDATRMAEIAGGRKEYRDTLMDLERYEFLLIHRRTRDAYISKMES
jgi:hypothetical protein